MTVCRNVQVTFNVVVHDKICAVLAAIKTVRELVQSSSLDSQLIGHKSTCMLMVHIVHRVQASPAVNLLYMLQSHLGKQ